MENENWVTGNVRLSLGGEPLDLQMTVPAQAVKPQRMLPVFQQMTDSFTGLAGNKVKTAGAEISCRQGCAACCRQAVPLAEIEAYQIAELVENLPEPRRAAIKKRFETAWHHFSDIGWFERLDECNRLSDAERETVVLQYFSEYVACPFLENESCSIHAARPLGCREYLVTSPAENCFAPTAENISRVELPVRSSGAVREATNTAKLDQPVNFVPLVLALEWASRHADEFAAKTGEQWMAAFFTNLTKKEILT